MADTKKELQKLFVQRDRYSNFGPIISSLKVHGFRGIEDLEIIIESPITAISGLNGTGKSTIAQLCVCAYKKPLTASSNYKREYVKRFFPVSVADPQPFTPDASVEYRYLTADIGDSQEVKVYRANSQWEGYKRQPERFCRYIGFSFYVPKIEQTDLTIYGGEAVTAGPEFSLSPLACAAVAKILNHPYEGLTSAVYSHRNVDTEIGFAQKYGKKYSENNMGLGEGRVFYLVASLETAPEQSLFVLEEPETSLHEHAQHELGKYLIDVSIRKKHQIILTTHSKSILNALPRESRKLLYRQGPTLRAGDRASVAEATGLLSLGHSQGKQVLVEDVKAKQLLTELIRQSKPTLLGGVTISFVGSDEVVANLTARFRQDSLNVVGVRDGDKGENVREKLFKLPGEQPPEVEVFRSHKVSEHLLVAYGIISEEWIALNQDRDFHDWPELLAEQLRKTEDGLWEELCRIYADGVDPMVLRQLVEKIEE